MSPEVHNIIHAITVAALGLAWQRYTVWKAKHGGLDAMVEKYFEQVPAPPPSVPLNTVNPVFEKPASLISSAFTPLCTLSDEAQKELSQRIASNPDGISAEVSILVGQFLASGEKSLLTKAGDIIEFLHEHEDHE